MSPPNRGQLKVAPTRVEQILAATVLLVGEHGCSGFTIQEVADRCRITGAGVMHHFKTKDQLLVAVMRHIEEREVGRMALLASLASEGAARTAPSKSAVVDFLRVMMSSAAAEPDLCRVHLVVQVESLNPRHPGHDYVRGREQLTLQLLEKLLAPFVTAPASAALQLLAVRDGMMQQWLRENCAFDLKAEWECFLQRLLSERAKTQGGAAHVALPAKARRPKR